MPLTKAEIQRRYVDRHGPEYIRSLNRAHEARHPGRKRAFVAQRRAFVEWCKASGCRVCSAPGDDFHHSDPATKEFNIGAGLTYAADRLVDEILKCDVFCHEHHYEAHRRLRAAS